MYAKGVKFFIGAAFMIALFVGVLSLLVMLLWNALIPRIFDGPELVFWEALGLLALVRLLVGGSWGRRRGHWKRKWSKGSHMWQDRLRRKVERMDPEERAAFFSRARSRCNTKWMESLEAEFSGTAADTDLPQSTSS